MNYIRDDIASDTSGILSNSNEFVKLLMLYVNSQHLLIVTIYRPPDCHQQKLTDMLNIIQNEINKLNSQMPDIVITGDFYFPVTRQPGN